MELSGAVGVYLRTGYGMWDDAELAEFVFGEKGLMGDASLKGSKISRVRQ